MIWNYTLYSGCYHTFALNPFTPFFPHHFCLSNIFIYKFIIYVTCCHFHIYVYNIIVWNGCTNLISTFLLQLLVYQNAYNLTTTIISCLTYGNTIFRLKTYPFYLLMFVKNNTELILTWPYPFYLLMFVKNNTEHNSNLTLNYNQYILKTVFWEVAMFV